MITITQKRVIDLEPGDAVGDASAHWYTVQAQPITASRAQGCEVRVQYHPDGGLGVREFEDRNQTVPVRSEATQS